jgi:hypothetical protein
MITLEETLKEGNCAERDTEPSTMTTLQIANVLVWSEVASTKWKILLVNELLNRQEEIDERLLKIVEIAQRKGKPAIRVLLADGLEFVSNAFCQFNGDPDFLKEQFERTVLEYYTHVFLLDIRSDNEKT